MKRTPKIKLKFSGKAIYFTQKQWEILKMRFNKEYAKPEKLIDRARGVKVDKYIIRVACPLCTLYFAKNCKGCTLRKFSPSKSVSGCLIVLREILKELYNFVDFGCSSIVFCKKNKKKAHEALDMILMCMERVEKPIRRRIK